MDKVFVITVCRNPGDLLEPTMLSVLHQSYENVGYIIVDGASTDGTVNLIRRYEHELSAWISEPDKGIYDAMNKGIRMVSQQLRDNESAWINFMNAGDRFSDDTVIESIFGRSALLDSSNNKDKALVIGGNTINVFSDGSIRIDQAELPVFLPIRLTFSHQACFVRYGAIVSERGNIERWKFDIRYKYAADYKLLLSIYKKYGEKVFIILNKNIACYRKDGSFSLLNQKNTRFEYLRIQSAWTSFRWWKEVIKFMLWIIIGKRI